MAYGNYAPFYRTGYFNPMQTPTMQNMAMTDNVNQYTPTYPQPIQQPPMQPATQPIATPTVQTPQMSNDMIWVQGLAGAKAYLVAPNTTVTLWDSENPVIYLKSCDSNGMPSMKILDIAERTETPQKSTAEHTCQCGNKFTLKEDFNALEGRFDDISREIEDLKTKVEQFSAKSTPKSTKKTEAE